MKKIYQTPKTIVVEIEMQALLQDSISMGGSKGTFNSQSGTQLGRSGSNWDDED